MKGLSMLVAVLALALTPALAEAKKIKHSGQIVADPNTRVTLKLTKKGGEIRKLSKFKARRVRTACSEGEFTFTFTAFDPTKVTKKGNFKERLKNADGSVLRIKGTVKKRGRKVIGFISSSDFDGGTAGTCRVPKQRFKTTKG